MLTMSLMSFSQKPDPVHFTYSCKAINDKQVEVHILATLDEGWHLYAQTQPKDAISIPTKITFTKNPLIKIASTLPKEIGEKEQYHDPVAGITQYQYAHSVEFVQMVTLKAKAKTNLSGTITYQVCTNEMCLPPKTVPFSLSIN